MGNKHSKSKKTKISNPQVVNTKTLDISKEIWENLNLITQGNFIIITRLWLTGNKELQERICNFKLVTIDSTQKHMGKDYEIMLSKFKNIEIFEESYHFDSTDSKIFSFMPHIKALTVESYPLKDLKLLPQEIVYLKTDFSAMSNTSLLDLPKGIEYLSFVFASRVTDEAFENIKIPLKFLHVSKATLTSKVFQTISNLNELKTL